ncbi:MAG: hypothetical protein JNL21_26135 [Myxococcales bacterium]|nr:hypothetical protein [Myxococcales bacterium]
MSNVTQDHGRARTRAAAHPKLLLFASILVATACDDEGRGESGAGAGTAANGGADSTGQGPGTSQGSTTGQGGTTSQGSTTGQGGSSTSSAGSGGGGGPDIQDPGTMTSDSRIYTTDGTEYVIDEVGDAFAHAAASATDNLVFYVHGRGCGGGGEPQKSLSEAMPELESDYGSRAILFNWQGSDVGCPLGFPEDQARAAGPAFAHTLHKLAFYKATHPGAFTGLKLTLITHSMGSFLLEEAMLTNATPLPATLFDTAMIGSAASARATHAAWVSQVALSPVLYVSLNAGDNVLTAASALGGVRLGKNVDGEPLAANALYVDFSASSVNHAYYLHGGQDGAHMTAFYDTIMNGLVFDFQSAAGIASVEARDGTFVYHFDGQ